VGAQSHLYIADRILELPQALIGLSLGAALLPRLAELSAPARRSELVGETADALYAALFVILPAAVGLWALAGPITQILFMRGDFTAADAEAAAAVLTVYAPLLFFIGLARVIAPAFYALKRSGAPAFAALVILAAHVAAGWILAPRFGLPGLAAATVLSGGLNFVWLGWIFQRRVGALPWRRFAAGVSRLLPGLVVLALICRSGYPALLAIGAGRILALGLVMASAMLVYFTLSLAPFQYFSRSPAGSAAQLFPSWATFVCMRRKRPSKR
jgi:putative peptidoglycan lipid II flippase